MRERILAIVITYNPNIQLLNSNIEAFEQYVDRILIWDNSPQTISYSISHSEKIEYRKSHNNSISQALNEGWRYASNQGYDYLLTMDQDSVFENFEDYKRKSLGILDGKLCVVGPSVNNISNKYQIISKDTIITSGMLVPIKLLEKANGWREDFTVDAIDIDFCLNVTALGYPIYQLDGCRLIQQFGTPEKRILFGKEIVIHNYNPSRLYGYAKNMYITLSEHGFPKSITTRYKKAIRNTLFYIILFEGSKYKKIKAIVRGLIDGIAYTRA